MARGWIIIALCFLMAMMNAGPIYYAYGNYSVAFAEEFAAPRSMINIGFTIVSLLGAIGSAPVGMLIDRWPVRYIAAAGAIGTGLGFYTISLTTSMWQVIAVFGTLVGLSTIGMSVVVINYMVSHCFERRRGFALGLAVLGTSAGAVLFPPLTDYLIGNVGWRQTFVIYAGLLFLLAPLIWIVARPPAMLPDQERVEKASRATGESMSVKAIFRMPLFWIISLAIGTMLGANGGVMVSLVSYAGTRGLTTAEGSQLLSAMGICGMVGKVTLGAAADRMNHRLAMQVAILVQTGGMALLAFATGYPALLIGCGLFGLGLGAMLPLWGVAMAGSFGLASYGRVLGLSRAIMTPIVMGFPILSGAMFDLTGEFAYAWLLFATLMAASWLALLFWKMPTKARTVPRTEPA